jgi:hypothetical protein
MIITLFRCARRSRKISNVSVHESQCHDGKLVTSDFSHVLCTIVFWNNLLEENFFLLFPGNCGGKRFPHLNNASIIPESEC